MQVANRFEISAFEVASTLTMVVLLLLVTRVVPDVAFFFSYVALLIGAGFVAANAPDYSLSTWLIRLVVASTVVYCALFAHHVYQLLV